MTIKSRIVKIDNIKLGESAGYGSRFIAERDSSLAVVGIGYGDGISRGWKEVLVAGLRVPVINYCMDCIIVDITDVKCVIKEFDEVVIIGNQNNETISWEEASNNINTLPDEQLQRITKRVPKYYFYKP
jgi:alanine racemase